MNFSFSLEQEALRQAARQFLAAEYPLSRVRSIMQSETGYDPAVWRAMADQGWQGMAIPEPYGGAGFGFLEVVILMEEMGRLISPVPFLSSVVLGANLVLQAGREEQRERLLPRVAAGERIIALAFTEAGGGWDQAGVTMAAKADGDEVVLSGGKLFVIDGCQADTLLVAAKDNGGIAVFEVSADAPGVERRAMQTLDLTRPMAEITFDGVRVPSQSRLGEGDAWASIERVLDLGAVALAAEQVGVASRCLEMAVDYAKVRRQFGRAIGSFQAIKHKCADMLMAVESARSAAYYAGWAVAVDDPELAVVAPLAKAYCSEACFRVAAENIQIHGGIGFTWEHDAHLYFKRAKSSQLLLGDPSYQRELLAGRLGL